MAIVLVFILFTISTSFSWRLSRLDALFILFGVGFLFISAMQRSYLAAIYSFQIFILPLLMTWVRCVPRSSIKAAFSLFAIVSALYVIGEFLVLNNDWTGFIKISSDSGIGHLYIAHREGIQPGHTFFGGSITGPTGITGDLSRPAGIFSYVLTSGVSLSMLGAFFLFESLTARKVVDYVITSLVLVALLVSTSTTGILAFMAAAAVLALLMKPTGLSLLKNMLLNHVKVSTVLFVVLGILAVSQLRPVIDTLYSRVESGYGGTGLLKDEVYRSSFVPSFSGSYDVFRFVAGGNGWEYTIINTIDTYRDGWQYQGTTLLIRESNLFNFIALFGIIPMVIVYWKWLTPLMRLRNSNYEMNPAGIPFLAGFLAGTFTMVHDVGIAHWNNIFFFYAYYELARRYQTPKPGIPQVVAATRAASVQPG
jgi:hypothetical protein